MTTTDGTVLGTFDVTASKGFLFLDCTVCDKEVVGDGKLSIALDDLITAAQLHIEEMHAT